MFYQYAYNDASGADRLQVNLDGFETILLMQGASNIIKKLMTDLDIKNYVKKGK